MKNKLTTKYVCTECGGVSPQWLGKCPVCNKFGTLVEEVEVETPNSSKTQIKEKITATPLSSVSNLKYERIKTGIKELDTALGGGIVPSSMILIGGDPGIGKSTILTQVAGELSKTQKLLYISAEESLPQMKLRSDRLGVTSDSFFAASESCMENILNLSEDYDFIVIDSIQAVYLEELSGAAGSVGQVRECAARLMRLAKSKHKTIFIIGHVTKEGTIAGPKVLEHIMDTVLYFEGEPTDNYKVLRAVKNRFGSAQEVGVFEMTERGLVGVSDYDGIFVSVDRGKEAGSIVTPSITGNRCMSVEVQSLVSKTVFGLPRRMPLGIDYNRLALILAVLERKAYVPFYNLDVYANAMGGIKLNEPSADLAIAMALVSANKNEPIDKYVACFGEIGLTGEVRPVMQAEKRVNECIKMGFKKVIVPKRNMSSLEKFKDKIELIPVSYVSQAVKSIFGSNKDN